MSEAERALRDTLRVRWGLSSDSKPTLENLDKLAKFITSKERLIRRLNTALTVKKETKYLTWTAEQRAQFLSVFLNKKVNDVSALRDALKEHPGLDKMPAAQVNSLAKDLLCGSGEKPNEAFMEYLDEKKGNGTYWIPKKKISDHRDVTAEDLKKYKVKL
jgi:hypothetical protein